MERVLKLLGAFYGAMGNPPTVDGALAAMAKVLAAKASDEAIQIGLERCMTETYPVRLPHILAKIPGLDADLNAEKRLAWETTEKFIKWLRWNVDRTSAYIAQGAPELSPRILGAIRRSGGFSSLLRMTDADYPHQQKRFFEEYSAAPEIELVAADPSKTLEMPKLKALAAAKSIDKVRP
jgi:hypothetical protein